MPLLGYHLIVVEGFACPSDPRCSVVWGFMPLLGPPMANRSWGRDQTKCSPNRPTMKKKNYGPKSPLPDMGYLGPLLEPGLGVGHDGGVWWPGLCPWGLAGLSPKRWHGTPFPWAHHLKDGPKGLGARSFGWRSKAGTLAIQSWAAEATSSDVEHHLCNREEGHGSQPDKGGLPSLGRGGDSAPSEGFQVPWGLVHEWGENWARDWHTDWCSVRTDAGAVLVRRGGLCLPVDLC